MGEFHRVKFPISLLKSDLSSLFGRLINCSEDLNHIYALLRYEHRLCAVNQTVCEMAKICFVDLNAVVIVYVGTIINGYAVFFGVDLELLIKRIPF